MLCAVGSIAIFFSKKQQLKQRQEAMKYRDEDDDNMEEILLHLFGHNMSQVSYIKL